MLAHREQPRACPLLAAGPSSTGSPTAASRDATFGEGGRKLPRLTALQLCVVRGLARREPHEAEPQQHSRMSAAEGAKVRWSAARRAW